MGNRQVTIINKSLIDISYVADGVKNIVKSKTTDTVNYANNFIIFNDQGQKVDLNDYEIYSGNLVFRTASFSQEIEIYEKVSI